MTCGTGTSTICSSMRSKHALLRSDFDHLETFIRRHIDDLCGCTLSGALLGTNLDHIENLFHDVWQGHVDSLIHSARGPALDRIGLALLRGQQGPGPARRAAIPTVPKRAQWSPATPVETTCLHPGYAQGLKQREGCKVLLSFGRGMRGPRRGLSLSLSDELTDGCCRCCCGYRTDADQPCFATM